MAASVAYRPDPARWAARVRDSVPSLLYLVDRPHATLSLAPIQPTPRETARGSPRARPRHPEIHGRHSDVGEMNTVPDGRRCCVSEYMGAGSMR